MKICTRSIKMKHVFQREVDVENGMENCIWNALGSQICLPAAILAIILAGSIYDLIYM